MNKQRAKIPVFIARCLWSYNPTSLDLWQDRRLIITQVLNYGDWKGLRWLYQTYSEKVIKAVLSSPSRGVWFQQVLNFWCVMLKVRLPKKVRERAIFRLDPYNADDRRKIRR